ncbi:hypothetical protein [Krasilnikoviella flava]|uniref:Uncharacterized protein n=1 Tax=Krasilnikoviella flava TaxID=526729 RepID=A0A1T5LNV2_9MICO|nr:hypothetical protein [Krasilnikoviella flava]SKC77673.1 hypothetical protein SAMN04324258_3646 [Krasilnikoviella flava]
MNVPDLKPETWVALAAAGVALLVGLVGPFVNARTQKRTLKAQREMANDDRLWAKRAELYEEILVWSHGARSRLLGVIGGTVTGDTSEGLRAFLYDARLPPHVQARLTAYASDRVTQAVLWYETGLRRLVEADLMEIENPTEGNRDYATEQEHDFLVTKGVMEQAISDELAGAPRGGGIGMWGYRAVGRRAPFGAWLQAVRTHVLRSPRGARG